MWYSSRSVVLYYRSADWAAFFIDLAGQKESQILEGHLMLDHVHMLLSIPPKYSVAQVMGFVKGKSAIHIARVYAGRRRSFVGQHFWARGYWVSTVGRDEGAVRRYIQEQEKEDRRLEQMELTALEVTSRATTNLRFERRSRYLKLSGFAGGS